MNNFTAGQPKYTLAHPGLGNTGGFAPAAQPLFRQELARAQTDLAGASGASGGEQASRAPCALH